MNLIETLTALGVDGNAAKDLIRVDTASKIMAGLLANPESARVEPADLIARTVEYTDNLLKELGV